MKKLLVAALAGLSLVMSLSASGAADDEKVVIAYQTGSVPYFVGIANGEFAKKTGWDIEFRRFNSAPRFSQPSPPAMCRSATSAPARSPPR
jgi:taurine transport system substrate-binding protein